ncbi:MAG: hypothetical protein MUE67_01795 [Anaerolineales bacterium]|nr:hypothetical protein [Anaerolineales bacterium]
MKTFRVLYHLARADFFERARRYSFLLILAAVIYLGVLVNNDTLFISLTPGDLTNLSLPSYRGEFNSAWIGTMTVLVSNLFLSLFSFYLINDCVQRDVRTGVGQIIATTPISRAAYLVGKWLSNCLVLFVLELILAASALIMVLLKHQAAVEPVALLLPFLVAGLPLMALVAALGVVMESVPWLRGVIGNVAYFFLWILIVTVVVFLPMTGLEFPVLEDPFGTSIFTASLKAAAQATYPGESIGWLGIGGYDVVLKEFYWPGLAWDLGVVARQWAWALIGLGLVLLSATWFGRFDPARDGLPRLLFSLKPDVSSQPNETKLPAFHLALPDLPPLLTRWASYNPFLGVLVAELRLLLKGRRWWWWAILIGLSIVMLTNLLPIGSPYMLPITWLWPLAIWSELGNRERSNNTYQMVFASARPVLRQLPAAWLAGVLATGLLTLGSALSLLLNSGLHGLAGWLGAVFFVPSLALALGVASSGSRLFQVVYLIWWYIGPFQKMAGLDFTAGPMQIYLLGSAGLFLLAAFWRGWQVHA